MHTKTSFKFLGATLACLIMAACGGGAGTSAVPGKNSGNNSSGGTSNTDWRIGTGTGADFIPTKLTAGTNINALFNGQTTTITANIVDNQGALIETPTTVTFSSPCITAKTSSITGGTATISVAGVAKVEYAVGTCFGDDVVRASISHNNTVSYAEVTLPKLNNKKIGTGTGSNFIGGQLAVNSATFYEGDITQITVNIVDNQNSLVTQPIQVDFHSPCIDNGMSSIIGGNSVTSSNGVVTAQYKVGKCKADDKITASATNGPSNTQTKIEAVGTVQVDSRRIGTGFGETFSEGTLEIGVGSGALAPGGTTTITAYVVNSNGDLATDAIPVIFSSPCLSAANATLTNNDNNNTPATNNTITTVNGKAVAVYTSKGCSGSNGVDAIKASATFRQVVLNAAANLAVQSDTAQTITFISASPQLINIKGTGGKETSILKFQVLGQGGSALKGVCVNFAPNTTAGGLALVPSKCNPAGPETYGSTTDANGYATVTVQAGTTATPVRVTATTDNGISTQSSQLAVTTGIPDQNSASLSVSNFAPLAWNTDGTIVTATMRMADAFNNPVPIGTAVVFTASGGSIDGSCTTQTSDGSCSVSWRSQSPRPSPISGQPAFSLINGSYVMSGCSDGSIECRKGRVIIVASAIGNESFQDGNGNGLYDDIDQDIFYNSNGIYNSSTKNMPPVNTIACDVNAPIPSASQEYAHSCDDLREGYIDGNFNFIRDAGEAILDFNQNGIFDSLPNGKYDGALCAGAAKANGDCTSNKVSVRQNSLLVMASNVPYYPIGLVDSVFTAAEQNISLTVMIADENGNGLPAPASVSVTTTNLKNAKANIVAGTLGGGTEPSTAVITITSDDDPTKKPSGIIWLNITSAGLTSSFSANVSSAY